VVVYGARLIARSFRSLSRANFLGFLAQLLAATVVLLIAIAAAVPNGTDIESYVTDPSDVGLSDGSSAIGRAAGSVGALVALLMLIAWGALFVHRMVNHKTILRSLTPGRFNPADAPPEPAHHRERLAFLSRAQTGNVTFFARAAAPRPFVGSGLLEEPWHLATPLVRRSGIEPSHGTLTIEAIYDAMRYALVGLADPSGREEYRLIGLSLQDRLFVPGLLKTGDPLLDRKLRLPRHRIDQVEMRDFARNDRNRATYYLAVRISAWEGELEVSIFLYFNIRGNTLYVEFVGASLPSINEKYHAIDSYELVDRALVLRLLATSLLDLPGLLIRSPLNLYRQTKALLRSSLDLRAQFQAIDARLAFDYGARSSVRELGADWETEDFFQRLDGKRYIHVVERRVIDAISEVLEEFGYEAEEFIKRTQSIIDNSTHTYIDGSTFNDCAIAVGSGSSATAMPPPSWSSARHTGAAPATEPNGRSA
jgi:hypothetical protein